MHYKFPVLENIGPIHWALEGRDEFGDYLRGNDANGAWKVIDYNVNFIDTFPAIEESMSEEDLYRAALRRECRGLVYDPQTGKILRRSFHKFFNINERLETQLGNLSFTDAKAYVKMDGSMIAPFRSPNGPILWATKMGVSETATHAIAFLEGLPLDQRTAYNDLVNASLEMGVTPIFEWCSRRDRIVVDYPEPQLVFLGARRLVEGTYLPLEEFTEYCDGQIPVVQTLDIDPSDPTSFLDRVRNLRDAEGFVITWNDGHRVKVKADWYCRLHKTKEMVRFEKDAIRLILNSEVDDVIPILPDYEVERLEKYSKDVMNGIHDVVTEVKAVLEADKGLTRKEFAMKHTNHRYSNILFGALNGRDIFQSVVDRILFYTGDSTRLNRVRYLFGNAQWHEDQRSYGIPDLG